MKLLPSNTKLDWKVSASQINAWNICPRRYAYKYLENLPDPAGKAAELGSKCHDVWEDYFKYTTQPDADTQEGRIVKAGLHLYPLPRDVNFNVEEDLIAEHNAVPYRAKLDLLWRQMSTLFVNDHKTSSNPRKYGLTEQSALDDPQFVLYTAIGWAWNDLAEPMPKLVGRWTYHSTKGAVNPFIVSREVGRAESIEHLERVVEPPAREILHTIRTRPKAKDVEPKLSGCDAFYKPCPFIGFCPVTDAQRSRQMIAHSLRKQTKPKKERSTTMGLMDRLRAKQAEAAQAEEPKPNKKLAPPRPSLGRGVRVNSPEAPSDVAEQRKTSMTLGERLTKSPKKNKEIAREVAVEARTGAETTPAVDELENQPMAPESIDIRKTSGNDILHLVSIGVTTFTSKRDDATRAIPFAHGRTLTKLVNEGRIEVEEDGGLRIVKLTPQGSAEEEIHAPNMEVSAKVEPDDQVIVFEAVDRFVNALRGFTKVLEESTEVLHEAINK